MRTKIILSTARKILTQWDYSSLDDIVKYGMVIDFKAMIVKLVVFAAHLLCVISLPLSVFVVIKIGRYCEIQKLKSWVKTMRADKGFFHFHYYIEIKQHINEHKDSYHLTLDW